MILQLQLFYKLFLGFHFLLFLQSPLDDADISAVLLLLFYFVNFLPERVVDLLDVLSPDRHRDLVQFQHVLLVLYYQILQPLVQQTQDFLHHLN